MNISVNQAEKNYEKTSISHVYHSKAQEKETTASAEQASFAWEPSVGGFGVYANHENEKDYRNILDETAAIDSENSKNYLVVMSNTLSDEDYKRLQEKGGNPANYEAGEMVTLMDQIKVTLAKAGVDIAGFTDNLNMAAIEEAGIGEGYAKAIANALTQKNLPPSEDNIKAIAAQLDNASAMKEMTDDAKKYLIENALLPTIDNLYKAGYAGGKQTDCSEGYYQADSYGYMAKKGAVDDLSGMDRQIEDIIKKAGLYPDSKAMEQAKWLLQNGLPLTEHTLYALSELEKITIPPDIQSVALAAADAILVGLSAKDGNLAAENGLQTADAGYIQKAVELEEKTKAVSDEAIRTVIREEKSINLHNLIQASKEHAPENQNQQEENEYPDWERSEFFEVKKQLVEIQLKMSAQANLKLLRHGISIDLEPLQQLAELLEKEESLYQATELNRTLEKTGEIKSLPAETIGISVKEAWMSNRLYTLEHVYETGKTIAADYAKAGQTYEALMTAPRSDLGDTIKEAFRNVDELLSENRMDVTDENRKAIRILGYNQMEITQENLQAVKEADALLQKVLNNMTPEKTLRMLREGVNPLSMNLDDLADYFAGMQDESDNLEKFSKYLYRMEQNHMLSDEEKEACIGVYRLLRQIEKGDDAAVGAVIANAQELNLENLLGAVRTRKKGYIDAKIDDAFGLIKEIRENGTSITGQIMNYYRNRAGNLTEEMANQGYENSEDMSGFYKSEAEAVQNAGAVSEDVFAALLDDGIGTSAHLVMANQLLSSSDSFVKSLLRLSEKNEKKEDFLKDLKRVSDAFEEGENAVLDEYEDFAKKAADTLAENAMESNSHIDVRSYAFDMRQISLWTQHAEQENYYVPMQLSDSITMVHIKILNGSKKGTVTIDLKDGAGNLSAAFASFRVRDDKVEGLFAVTSKGDTEKYQKIAEKCSSLVLEKTGKETDITCVYSQTLKSNTASGDEKTASTKELYQIAKAFMESIEQEVTRYESEL